MTKHLLAGVAGAVFISGSAFAQLYARAATTSWHGGNSRASAASCPSRQHDDHDRFSKRRARSQRNYGAQGG